MDSLKLGILGTGRIAKRFVDTCGMFREISVSAVFNPRVESTEYFTNVCGLKDALATCDWEEFLGEINMAYVATPHETHYEYVKKLLDAGIHVLCEKPLAFKGREAVELFEIAKDNGLILMEAVKTAYCPGFNGINELIKRGDIGDVVDVEACFTRLGNSNVREIWNVNNGGSFAEFGTYTLLPIVKFLGTKSMETYAWSNATLTGVDSYTKLLVSYDKATATAKTGLGAKSEGQLVIAGTQGYILVPSPWWLTKHVEVHYEDSRRVDSYNFEYEGSGLQYEMEVFFNRVLAIEGMGKAHFEDQDFREKLSAGWDFLENDGGVNPYESIWMAGQMELFREHMGDSLRGESRLNKPVKPVNIWAHRGCSMAYPENSLEAFVEAARLPGITGIELDIQLTKDGEIVVIHDERIDRTTTGSGYVKDFTFEELRKFDLTGSGQKEAYESKILHNQGTITQKIPTMREVFEALKPFCLEKNLLINIELKNSVIRYEGMEEKILALVGDMGLEDYVVYSSFNHESMGLIKKMQPTAKTGALGVFVWDCLKGVKEFGLDAVHPSVSGFDICKDFSENEEWGHIPVRAWNSEEPFFGDGRVLKEKCMGKYGIFGATDIITNVPELYV